MKPLAGKGTGKGFVGSNPHGAIHAVKRLAGKEPDGFWVNLLVWLQEEFVLALGRQQAAQQVYSS